MCCCLHAFVACLLACFCLLLVRFGFVDLFSLFIDAWLVIVFIGLLLSCLFVSFITYLFGCWHCLFCILIVL